ncbi:hypothetical protein CHU32_07910 [Superficieibacter electus]|uniref:Uncharacterized protein n=2 Tax=Superficieibacter electus TaxID=2022662 RepID=A0A2P5GSN3_9ENTR|nr:hypothetical protein CHU33_04960 [Superficieibacter electus]POP49567.1 hypothetical protein CHU32_07910 [Superficieibacter electus]
MWTKSLMNTDLLISRLDEIEQQITLLRHKPCQCERNLEVKIRHFGGGEHYVRQCNQCGRQKGGALKAPDALTELDGQPARAFDPALEEEYNRELTIRHQKLSLLSREKIQLLSALNGGVDPLYVEQEKKYREAFQKLSEHLDTFIESFDIDKTLLALSQQQRRIKKVKQEHAELNPSLFSSETELKAWMVNLFKSDFYIYQEVTGVHVTEGINVRIDYVFYPRAHLVEEGFEPAPFGIEVKYLSQEKSFAHKAGRSVWQAISYNDCEFSLKDRKFNLKFCLLFSNLSFSNEREVLALYSDHSDDKSMKWAGMLNVANHAKVGVLKITGKREKVKGWSISFAGGLYFSCHLDKDGNRYKRVNENMVNKVRVGSF